MIPLQFLDSERPHMTELQPGRYRHFKGNEYEVLAIPRAVWRARVVGAAACDVY